MIALILCVACACLSGPGDPDSDRDGLSDFLEIHKYFTDPKNPDSDGDGLLDGDWNERREFAYSVRAVMYVMAPFDVESMNDDYQDARVLERWPDLCKFEAVVYPFNTVAGSIESDPKWRAHTASLKEYTRAGLTNNWDTAMRTELVTALKKDAIDVEALDDREVASQVSRWLMKNSKYEEGFTVFTATFEHGKPRVEPRLKSDVDAELAKMKGRSIEEQWRRELFGKSMFEARVHGACTSTAIFLSTSLKSLGLPTRTVVCIPVIDSNDEHERAWLNTAITHPTVRKYIRRAMGGSHSWTSHTFNEVFVGGRWRRLNYDRLGQNVLDDGFLGLMVHVHTFSDHADSGLIGWGLRLQHPRHDELFGGNNPYSCVELSDLVGAHAKLEIPKDDTLRELTISRLYWFDDPTKDPSVDFSKPEPDNVGKLLFHVEEPDVSASQPDLAEFYSAVGKQFVLRVAGHDDVLVNAARGFWFAPAKGVREFYLRIDADELAKMQPGVPYELAYRGSDGDRRWKVPNGLMITLPKR